jgi:single-strand DNA-binding protein
MSLSHSAGEWGIVTEPEMRFSNDGKPWLKIRGVSKDRKFIRETNTWEDGEPCYMDIVVNGKMAENLAESVGIGDQIIVIGSIAQREWKTDDGKTQKAYTLRADSVGVSTRYVPVSKLVMEKKPAAAFPNEEAGAPF